MAAQSDEIKRKQFRWGMLLAWSPFLVFVLAFLQVFREISTQKATGIGAVAGGFSEALVTFGVAVILVFEIMAIVLLVRAFSSGHAARSALSVLTILFSGLMLLVVSGLLWLSFSWRPH